MVYEYIPRGVCSRKIIIDTDGETVNEIRYVGGCSGNTQGVAKLAQGRKIDEVIELLDGIKCGYKPTSCPDQLAQALKQIKEGKIA